MKRKLNYEDWSQVACTAGIDFKNNPPPKEFITEELCIDAFRCYTPGTQLELIPLELRTEKVCWAAFYNDDDALQFVPENLREELQERKDAITEKQWLDKLSLYEEPGNHYYIKLTKKLLTPEFCRALVKLFSGKIGLSS